MNRNLMLMAVLIAVGLAIGNECSGLGIRQPEQGAAATAQNDAFVAQADDPSAIYYNPAGLLQIKGTETMSGAYIIAPSAHYDGDGAAAGNSKGTQNQISLLPHVYAVSDFGIEWFRAGIGLYTPFGESVDWGNNNSFRYVTTSAMLNMVNVNPTVAFQIRTNLFLGLGLDYYYCETDIRQAFPFVVPGPVFAGEGNIRFQGTGDGFGFNVGGMYKLTEQHVFGLSYRSQVDVEFDGHAKVSSIPGFLGFGNKVKEHARSEFHFPQIVQFGYAFWPTPKWKLEVDGDWTNWDVTNANALKSQGLKSTFGLTQSQLKTKLNWEDSWIVSLGTQYEIKDGVFLRGGWYWSQNSVPEKNFTPTVADSDRTGVSAGLGLKWKSWTMDLACQANFSLDRDGNNNVGSNPFPPVSQSVDGTYKSWSIAGAFSLRYHY